MLYRFKTLAVLGTFSFLLVACGGGSGSSSSGGGSNSIAGRWTATFQVPGQTCVTALGSTTKLTVRLDLALSQNGQSVTGTFRTTPILLCGGSSSAATGTIKGTVSGANVDLTDSDGATYDLRIFHSNVNGMALSGHLREGTVQITTVFDRP